MKKTALVALALLASLSLSAPASAASTVSVDLPDTVLYFDCFDIPVPIKVSASAPAVRYEATVTLHDPEGFRDEFLDEDPFFPPTVVSGSVPAGGATSAKTAKVEVCGFEAPGLWRADLKVEFFDSNDGVVETAKASDTANFRQANIYTTLTRSRIKRTLVIGVELETPNGTKPCKRCRARLQEKSGKKWEGIVRGDTNRKGVFRTGVLPERHVKYRAVVGGWDMPVSVSPTFVRR